ncbi:MAG: hypothetical protein LBD48_12285 [Treponema sp.]|jgi:xylulokinase|nr:hypothetical protein [Treponema sp.]
MLVMGIDVGTTGAKAAVFDEKGNQRGYGFEEYGIHCPRSGWAEQDGEEVWNSTKRVIAQSVAECGGREGRAGIAALSLSVQGDAVIPLDHNRNALGPAQLGMDYRGAEEAAYLAELFGGHWLFQHTGMRAHPLNSLVKIVWLLKNDPGLFEKAQKLVTYADFIMAKLGSDDIVIDKTMASRTMALELDSGKWSPAILEKLSIDPDKLGVPVPSGTVVGRLSSPLASELGIRAGALLVAGGHDQSCAALGAGIIDETTALDSHGTAEVVSAAFFSPRTDDCMYESFYPCYFHTVPGMYCTFALNHTGGILLKWFVEQFCHADAEEAKRNGERLYELVLGKENSGKPSPVIVLPHFNGSGTPSCVTSAKGAILGLTMTTTRHDVARAVNEALSFELKINLQTMEKAGIGVKRLRCAGGGARSPLGLQSKADITGLPFSTLKIREAACLGAAILAGIAAGVWKNTGEAAGIIETGDTYYPNQENVRLYNERFDIYRQIYDTLTIKKLIHGL